MNAEIPLIVAGSDIRAAGAQREMLELAENYSLPVAVAFFDYGGFPLQHPNYVGMLDAMSDNEYDVVCCIGYRQNTRSSLEDEKFSNADTVMAIGQDAAMMGNTFALDLEVLGNVKHSLAALNALWTPDHSNLAHLQKRRMQLAAHSEERAAKPRRIADDCRLRQSPWWWPLDVGE